MRIKTPCACQLFFSLCSCVPLPNIPQIYFFLRQLQTKLVKSWDKKRLMMVIFLSYWPRNLVKIAQTLEKFDHIALVKSLSSTRLLFGKNCPGKFTNFDKCSARIETLLEFNCHLYTTKKLYNFWKQFHSSPI